MHGGTSDPRGLCEGHGLSPGGRVSDEAHGVQRFTGSPTGDEDAHASQVARTPSYGGIRRRNDAVDLGHTPDTRIVAGERPGSRINHHHATFAQHRDVVHGRWVLPHFGMHSRCHDEWSAASQHGVA